MLNAKGDNYYIHCSLCRFRTDCSEENNYVNENGREDVEIEIEEKPEVIVNGNSMPDWKTTNSYVEDDQKNVSYKKLSLFFSSQKRYFPPIIFLKSFFFV